MTSVKNVHFGYRFGLRSTYEPLSNVSSEQMVLTSTVYTTEKNRRSPEITNSPQKG